MDDDQFRQMKQLIHDLTVRVAELELHLKRQDEIADHRFSLLYDWCAPAEYRSATEEADIPDDLKKFFG